MTNYTQPQNTVTNYQTYYHKKYTTINRIHYYISICLLATVTPVFGKFADSIYLNPAAINSFTNTSEFIPLVDNIYTLLNNNIKKSCIYKHEWPPRNNPSILIPLYTSGRVKNGQCSDIFFQQVAKGCRSTTAILNANNGPASTPTAVATLRKCIELLQNNGVKMLGYVSTKNAYESPPGSGNWKINNNNPFRTLEYVKNAMQLWVSQTRGFSKFEGFFLDEVSNYYQTHNNIYNKKHTPVYQKFITAGKKALPRAHIVINPGSFPDLALLNPDRYNGFLEPAETTTVFETAAIKWRPPNDDCRYKRSAASIAQGSFKPGPWCHNTPHWDGLEPYKAFLEKGNTVGSVLIYNASMQFALREAQTAHKQGIRFFFATNLPINNPWMGVPSYWADYLAFLNHKG